MKRGCQTEDANTYDDLRAVERLLGPAQGTEAGHRGRRGKPGSDPFLLGSEQAHEPAV